MTGSAVAPRSWLYVPATRPELVAKALAGPADAVVVDLEDAVPADAKDAARDALVAALAQDACVWRTKPLWVRTNHPATAWGAADLAALHDVAGTAVDGVRLPKAEDADLVADVAGRLGRPLHLLVETALGLRNADVLARAHPQVTGIALGEADLLADLGGLDSSALAYARGHVVATARAAGLGAPVMSVWTDLADLDGLRADTERARALGFVGRSVVHPRQVPVVHEAFTPRPDEVAAAHRVVAALDAATRRGSAVVVDDAGRFVDAAVVNRAKVVLGLARRGDGAATTPPSPDQENR
ncbi:citrate lyase subunit beta / citryl-CoA lyase [Jatrophihabitans endophyticus]|uniref:Citrate lyase subunit beta / citryl-CoA lyase n=1 Tax=Jatrophihabitans endophyticus TaxID=1206085 RepID=A0A1M5M0U5_9ACTN|nr:CoA ester lyase [Jatrophihabitans endophyticus]SHG70878.1 citrate lyase subunit beta / citryl-CoA lyase [Jatrophihabitans endophyticus]